MQLRKGLEIGSAYQATVKQDQCPPPEWVAIVIKDWLGRAKSSMKSKTDTP